MNKWLWLALVPSLLFADSSAPEGIRPASITPLTTNEIPVEIEVRAGSITLLASNTLITCDELQVMDNPFNQLWVSFISNRVCPNIQFHTEAGGEDLEKQLRGKFEAVRVILGCPHRFSRLFEVLEEARLLEQDPDPSTFIPPQFTNLRQNPIYIDVEANQLTLVEEKNLITEQDLMAEGNEFERFLDRVELHKDTHYIVLLLRPGSAVFQRRLRQIIRDRDITVEFEPWEAGRKMMTNAITVLVTTPKAMTGDDKRPAFFECRNQQLFSISLERLQQVVADKTDELQAAADGDVAQFLRLAARTMIMVDGYRLDFTFAMMGKYVLFSAQDAEGYAFKDDLKETSEMWFGAQLAKLDPQKQFLYIFVRPDSFNIFRQARALAWMNDFTVTSELLDEKEPIMLGPRWGPRFVE